MNCFRNKRNIHPFKTKWEIIFHFQYQLSIINTALSVALRVTWPFSTISNQSENTYFIPSPSEFLKIRGSLKPPRWIYSTLKSVTTEKQSLERQDTEKAGKR